MAEYQQMLKEDHLASKVQADEVKDDQEYLSIYESEMKRTPVKMKAILKMVRKNQNSSRHLGKLQLTKTSYTENMRGQQGK